MEAIDYCKQCSNRQIEAEKGLVCSLTQEKPNFTGECAHFVKDEASVPAVTEEFISIQPEEQLSERALLGLKMEQNLPLGVITALLVGVVGSILWAAITVATGYQIGYMAIALGAGVGLSMRLTGKGIDPIFGYAGAAIAILSCVIGNFLGIISYYVNEEGGSYIETLLQFDYGYFIPVMTETFSIMDVLFYGIAAFQGYKLSFRVVTLADIKK